MPNERPAAFNGALPPKPAIRPADPRFSSGPTKKRPDWSVEALGQAVLGRSHRSKPAKTRLQDAIARTRALLHVPEDYRIAITPGSDTGAVEMAMWSMLGAAPLTVLAWESFGEDWVIDAVKELKLPGIDVRTAPYGALPDTSGIGPDRDIVFTWNGTTSGVRVPNADWISADRTGIVICDATSAAFCQPVEWSKCDVVTYSWQKALGGEAAHGVLILSPRGARRLETHVPPWPLPKLFRMTKAGKLIEGFFEGDTINTPSMLCVEDYIDALKWADRMGGLPGLMARADANAQVIWDWTARTSWVDNLCADPALRSNTGVCLKIVDPRVTALPEEGQADFAKKLAALLDREGVALDAASYRSAPPGLRIWCGPTVETADLEALTPWLDWAFAVCASDL